LDEDFSAGIQNKMSGKQEAAAKNNLKGRYNDKGTSSWKLWLWRVRLDIAQKGGVALLCRRWDIFTLGNFLDVTK